MAPMMWIGIYAAMILFVAWSVYRVRRSAKK